MMNNNAKILMSVIEIIDRNESYYELWPDLLFELNRLLEDRHGITLKQAVAEAEVRSTISHRYD